MPGPGELYPPVQYVGGWLLLAVGIIVALLIGLLLVLSLTRPRLARSTERPDVPLAPAQVLDRLRGEYLGLIAEAEQRYRAGEVDARRANAELSRLVRAFVNEYSGLEAPVLTLEDLRARGVHPALIDALQRHYYPSVFRRGPAVDPAAGAEAARRVVTTWH